MFVDKRWTCFYFTHPPSNRAQKSKIIKLANICLACYLLQTLILQILTTSVPHVWDLVVNKQTSLQRLQGPGVQIVSLSVCWSTIFKEPYRNWLWWSHMATSAHASQTPGLRGPLKAGKLSLPSWQIWGWEARYPLELWHSIVGSKEAPVLSQLLQPHGL